MYNKHTVFPHILGDVTKLIDSLIKFILVLFHKWLNQSMIDYHRAIVGHWQHAPNQECTLVGYMKGEKGKRDKHCHLVLISEITA